MPYRTMSLEDFARYVGMDARDVRREADRGNLPGQKISGEWRFNRARVTEWLQERMHTLDEQRLLALENAMGEGSSELVATGLIGLEGVEPQLHARTKASALRELVGLAERTGLLYDAKELLDAVQEREEMCSTALPNGVAIPHPRQPNAYNSMEPFICFGRVGSGIGFGSADGGLTDIFLLIVSHEDRAHLHVLARLMRMLTPETVESLRHAPDRQTVLSVLIEAEKAVSEKTR